MEKLNNKFKIRGSISLDVKSKTSDQASKVKIVGENLTTSPTNKEDKKVCQKNDKMQSDNPQDKELRNIERKLRRAYRKQQKDKNGWTSIPNEMREIVSKNKEKINTKFFSIRNDCFNVHNIARFELLDDVYFDKKGFKSSLEKLRTMALDENWGNSVLSNYIMYTYAKVKADKEITISEDELHACWNTGLVDYRYQPIYCYMTRENSQKMWVFNSFCISGENSGKYMNNAIPKLPKRAVYFEASSLLCQPTQDTISVDYEHIIKEHPERLPIEWIKKIDGYKDIIQENREINTKRLKDHLSSHKDDARWLTQQIKTSVEESLERCQWNYKTAIPYYEPISGSIGWFLPLCVSGKEGTIQKPFAALVVTKGMGGRFQGQTIYKLSWAYSCARLVCRPDSDWLTPQEGDATED